MFDKIELFLGYSNSTPTSHFHLYHIVFYRFFYLIFTDYFSFKYNKFANGGYFGAPLAIQSVHYDGYHGVL